MSFAWFILQIYFPDGLTASDIMPRLLKKDVVVAGGLHASIKDKYFRIGYVFYYLLVGSVLYAERRDT
ncbi:hypothetical protein EDD15DRAFT_2237352 [Pisolithus albus]|nr:hypothetical protein EDD15DRAFT_2237352 [Pisolithus albus]